MPTPAPADPTLSVVIAAYNAESTLDAQLDALERQEIDVEWELLVCDNGSTDGTADLVRRRIVTFPRLRLVDASRRRGPGAARNDGARAARGTWLAFCDADDVVADDWLRQMVVALSEHPFVTGMSRRPELNSRPEDPRWFSWSIYHVPFFPHLGGAGSGNMGIRAAIFRDVGGFDESLQTGEDLDLCWRVQLAGYPLVAHPAAVVNVSNREGLRASFAQAFAYGVGDKRLAHKYALVARAYETAQAEDDPAEVAVDPVADSDADDDHREPERGLAARVVDGATRALRKLVRLRRLSDLTDITHRTASALGFRFGRIDADAPQVTPPALLPGRRQASR